MRSGWIVAFVVLALALATWSMFRSEVPASDEPDPPSRAEAIEDVVLPPVSAAASEIERSKLGVVDPSLTPQKARGGIVGRLVDGTGNPLAGVGVRAMVSESEACWQRESVEASSDASSCFRLAELPAGFHHSLEIAAKSLAVSDGLRYVLVRRDSDLDVGDITLVARTRVLGTVVDTNGSPLTGVVVHPDRDELAPSESTAADGRFEIMVTPGELVLLEPSKEVAPLRRVRWVRRRGERSGASAERGGDRPGGVHCEHADL